VIIRLQHQQLQDKQGKNRNHQLWLTAAFWQAQKTDYCASCVWFMLRRSWEVCADISFCWQSTVWATNCWRLEKK